jgi:PadR family transcriptional regulator, regulatory protein AphA
MKSNTIRLTSTSYAVLSLLDLLGEATPYDLKRLLEASVENFWPVPHTTFYEEPSRLAGAGYLSFEQESGGRRRKRYALTDSGREALREWANSPDTSPPQLRDEGMLKIFAGADPRPILAARVHWQRTKLAELEGYLAALRSDQQRPRADKWRGAEATLIAGVTYHRLQLEEIERFLGEDAQAATGSS